MICFDAVQLRYWSAGALEIQGILRRCMDHPFAHFSSFCEMPNRVKRCHKLTQSRNIYSYLLRLGFSYHSYSSTSRCHLASAKEKIAHILRPDCDQIVTSFDLVWHLQNKEKCANGWSMLHVPCIHWISIAHDDQYLSYIASKHIRFAIYFTLASAKLSRIPDGDVTPRNHTRHYLREYCPQRNKNYIFGISERSSIGLGRF